MRILLVEDDPATARSIELMLLHANFNVYLTDMGEEGVDLAKLYDYDLILLDLDLPDMNGMEVLRQIRMSRIDTPILITDPASAETIKYAANGFLAMKISFVNAVAAMCEAVGADVAAQVGRLAGAVATGQRDRLTLTHLEVEVVDDDDRTEGLLHSGHLEHSAAFGHGLDCPPQRKPA